MRDLFKVSSRVKAIAESKYKARRWKFEYFENIKYYLLPCYPNLWLKCLTLQHYRVLPRVQRGKWGKDLGTYSLLVVWWSVVSFTSGVWRRVPLKNEFSIFRVSQYTSGVRIIQYFRGSLFWH